MLTAKLTNPNLVTGRTGELADYANEYTYKVVERIFGYNGSYRRALHKFGIGNLANKQAFLKLIDGRIYTDLGIETDVLWKPCSYKVCLVDGKAMTSFCFLGLRPFLGFLKKTLIEIFYITFADHLMAKVDRLYKFFSTEVEQVFVEQVLSMDRFLSLYEDVVYISYFYELIFNYNNSKGFVNKSEGLEKYIHENDFMLSQDTRYVEFVHKLPQDFVFGPFDLPIDTSTAGAVFIPTNVPDYMGAERGEIRAEAKLQCVKNNMRLKTNVLLYFLNQTLYGGLSRNRTGA